MNAFALAKKLRAHCARVLGQRGWHISHVVRVPREPGAYAFTVERDEEPAHGRPTDLWEQTFVRISPRLEVWLEGGHASDIEITRAIATAL